MKSYLFEKEVKTKAVEFVEYLAKNNFSASLVEDSVRDYTIKISIFKSNEHIGYVSLYYKPTKDSYTLTTIELRKEFVEEIESLWNRMTASFRIPVYEDRGIEIDVDGAYRDGYTGYAAIIRKDGKPIYYISGVMSQIEVLGSYQVAGELNAVVEALKWCEKNGIQEVKIYYDMEGIEMWASGRWKTKKDITKNYSDFFKDNKIKIQWIKVEAHSGYKWNEEVDRLAKRVITEFKRKNN